MAENDEPMIQTPADFGHFLLEKELGHGGMGGVYLARDKMLDRRVGIKVMLKSLGADPKFVERFQREAQAAARLNHPNIAQIYSFGQEQGMPYIAMELVPGGSLDKEMEANPGTLDVAYVMRVGQQVADALALAAESGLVHGDVKPENVLFDSDGNAKLVDFGLAAMQGDSDEIWGTPFYISPEKVRRQKIDYRADIYSLGGTLYHVLTGVPPFDGPDPTAVVKARFEGPPKKPSEIRPDIPPEVDAIIMRMLELEPSMRYPTYQSLLGDFKRYLAKAGPAKAGKSSGPKLKFKGMKPKVAPSSTGNMAMDGEVADLQPVDDLGEQEEEKKPMSVGLMVGLVLGGIILLVLLVAGGLWWYVSSSKTADEQKTTQEILDRQQKARQSIEKTVKALKEEYAEFHKLVLQGDKAVEAAVREVKNTLPKELQEEAAGVLDPEPLPVIAEAVAFTNALFGGKSSPPEAKTATAPALSPQDMQSAMAAARASGKTATPAQIEALAKKILASVKGPGGKPLDSASPEYRKALDEMKANPQFALFAQMAEANPAVAEAVMKTVGDPAALEKALKEMGGAADVKGEAKKSDAEAKKPDTKEKKGDGKPAAKKDAEAEAEDKDAEAEKAQAEAEAKAAGKEEKTPAAKAEKKPAKKNAKKPAKKSVRKADKEEESSSEEMSEEKKEEAEEEKKDDEAPAEEKPAENAVPAIALPQAVKNYEKVWVDVCQYRAADIRLHGEVQKLLKKAEDVKKLTEQDEDTANSLATLANELVEEYTRIKGEKWLVDAKRKVHGIDARSRSFREEAVRKIKQAVERRERALKEKQEAEKREAEKKAAAEKLKATIEGEQTAAAEAFENLEGAIKRLDWRECTNTLNRLQAKMTTREGKDAVKDQLHKVEVMAGMQRHLIKHVKGFKFSDSSMVMDVDGTVLTIKKVKLDAKRKPVLGKDNKPAMDVVRIQWKNFYAHLGPGGKSDPDYPGYMFQLMNAFVRNGRKRTGLGPKEWNEYMLGAAFTLTYFYSEQKFVAEKVIPMFVQEAVKGFEPSREWAAKWFPDVKLEDPDE